MAEHQTVQDSNQTNSEALRKMTGAPNIHQPLVSEDAFADIDISSERPIWKLPLPKLAFVAVALVPVFGFAGFFLVGSRGKQEAAAPTEPLETGASNEGNNEMAELQEAEQEIATLKSKMALDDQAYVPPSPSSDKPATSSTSGENGKEEVIASSSQQAEPVSVKAAPPPINYQPPQPAIRTTPSPVDRTESTPQLSPVESSEPRDPFEQWQQLAQIGSYGSAPRSRVGDSSGTELAVENASISNTEPISSIPTAYFASTSAIAPTYEPAIFRESESVEQLPSTNKDGPIKPAILDSPGSFDKVESPPVLQESEARILDSQISDNQVLETPSQVQSLVAGGHSAGELVTPVVLDNEGVEDRFLVVMTEPLTDNASKVAIPSGSLLVVKVDRTSEDGLVQLSATQAIWEEQGLQRELVIPDRTILIRGDGGNPLMAEGYGNSSSDIAAMDMGQFALGAIRRVGELYTRSDARVQTSNGTTVVTESNPSPNILAGILQGGSDAILDSISERNQRAIEKLERRPKIPYIPAGKSVQVFVNQSVQMPTSF